MARQETPRIAVLGAGPVGLEAALYARRLQLPVKVYERGRVGDHVQRWGHVRLFSPFGMNTTPLGLAAVRAESPRHDLPGPGDSTTGREHLAAYLEPLAKSLGNAVRTDAQVVAVGRRGFLKGQAPGDARRGQQPFRLLVREGKGQERVEEADVVLDCTGTYGQHRWLGDGGIPAVGETAAAAHIAYGLDDIVGERRVHYAGKTVLVVGGGYSAATSVCNLAALGEQHPETWAIWLARGAVTQPLRRLASDPLKERDRLAARANNLATRPDGNVEFHAQTVVEAVECAGPDKGFKVTARVAGKPRTWEVDRVIANVGYTPDSGLYRELHVHECYASLGPMNLAAALLKHAGDGLAAPPQPANALRNPEPNFYVLGAKSYGRNSQFLVRTGFEQVREVFTLITGRPDLDLYKNPM
jgi:2-polyprenyl-6-methoxyphenol hydroxylase-like FAD-dependent oxidoreductase